MVTLAEATAKAVIEKIPDFRDDQLSESYFYQSLPLCMIDAVFSIGVRYKNAENVVDAWCNSQQSVWSKWRSSKEVRHTIDGFLGIINGLAGDILSDKYFGGNRQRTSTKNGILKSDATVLYAKALKTAEVNDFNDIRDNEKATKARNLVSKIPGHSSGISFDYFQMLSGDDGFVKADRMICRFVAASAGLATVTPDQARSAVIGAANIFRRDSPHITPRLLDHIIWKYQKKIKILPCRRTSHNIH